MKGFCQFCFLLAVASASVGATLPPNVRQFIANNCFECHDGEVKKGGLDLTGLKFDPANSTNFSTWVLVHDRVSKGEMPPRKAQKKVISDQGSVISDQSSVVGGQGPEAKKGRPAPEELEGFTNFLA